MKKILILAPNFPPSNLAGVHRSRLFAQHLPEFGWEPIILTVEDKYHEETLDYNLFKLLPEDLRIEKVNAFKITRPRIIGDIGLRSFFQIYNKAKKIIKSERIDFLYIPIPPFYIALLGRMLHKSTGVTYGIDYIDPWVHKFPGSDKMFSRHWWSSKIAKLLEPVAVKKASLITGVAEGYYKGMQQRNTGLLSSCTFGAMPYGGEIMDHQAVQSLNQTPYLFQKTSGKIILVYAGAMLPNAYRPLEMIFTAISNNSEHFKNIEFHFIGTGKTTNDPHGYTIKPLAEKYSLWNTIVFEYPRRIPYLDVLIHLEAADGVFILGSTEPHYTPSKVYQGVMAHKPLFAILHKNSTAVDVIKNSRTGIVLTFDGENDLETIKNDFAEKMEIYKNFKDQFNPLNIQMDAFEQYSAKAVTRTLVKLIEDTLSS
ncbi:MAG: hypothetical protein WKF85_00960 [Chitinophagaceae bacterium]